MPTPDPVRVASARLAYYSRQDGRGDPAKVSVARRDMAAAKLERHIQEVVDAAPPLTQQQREHLASLLTGGVL